MKRILYIVILLALAQMSISAQKKDLGSQDTLFFVKDEGLYYAAIASKDIPPFDILSNHQIINYASCLKAILQASGVKATYDEIIRKYLSTSIDKQVVPLQNRSKKIGGRRVLTTFIPQSEFDAQTIVNELLKKQMMIAIEKGGNVGLLTTISLANVNGYQPAYVRMRLPVLTKDEQRVQMSWKDFSHRAVPLVKVEIK